MSIGLQRLQAAPGAVQPRPDAGRLAHRRRRRRPTSRACSPRLTAPTGARSGGASHLALLAGRGAGGGSLAADCRRLGPGPDRHDAGEVERALHVTLEGEPIEPPESCVEMVPEGPDQGIWFMFEEHRLTRISIGAPSRVKTPRGIGIGATAAAVRRAYGKGLNAEPHYYEDLPAEYLTFWTVPGKRGVRFETDSKRRVQTIHAGNAAIELVEGCALDGRTGRGSCQSCVLNARACARGRSRPRGSRGDPPMECLRRGVSFVSFVTLGPQKHDLAQRRRDAERRRGSGAATWMRLHLRA